MQNAVTDLFRGAMELALEQAGQARGQTAPNPMVGAAVLSPAGEVIGQGFHPKAGEPHAEVFAINNARQKQKDLSGCTLVVTLEPCNHFGRTPPCVDLILESGIKRVVVGTEDPNPLMQGKSIQRLRQNGVEVETGVLESECENLIRGFRSVVSRGRPFVTLKCATSLDGKIATSTGESQWITDEAARSAAHVERAAHDSILVGVETIIADNPRLNVRAGGTHAGLRKIILDSNLRTPPRARVFETAGPVIIYCGPGFSHTRKTALEESGAAVVPVSHGGGGLNLVEVLEDLARHRGAQELMVEGGARVLGSFVRQKLFDRILYFVAPRILGASSRDVFEGLDVRRLSESIDLENITTRVIGRDIVIEGVLPCSQA